MLSKIKGWLHRDCLAEKDKAYYLRRADEYERAAKRWEEETAKESWVLPGIIRQKNNLQKTVLALQERLDNCSLDGEKPSRPPKKRKKKKKDREQDEAKR